MGRFSVRKEQTLPRNVHIERCRLLPAGFLDQGRVSCSVQFMWCIGSELVRVRPSSFNFIELKLYWLAPVKTQYIDVGSELS